MRIFKEYCCNQERIKHEILRVLFEHWRKTSLRSTDPNDLFISSSKIATLTNLKCSYKDKVSCLRELDIGNYIKMDFPNDGTEYVSYRLEQKGETAFIDNKFKNQSDSIRKTEFDKFQKIGVIFFMLIGVVIAYLTLVTK